jgi:beta-glucanase (GH16 family)
MKAKFVVPVVLLGLLGMSTQLMPAYSAIIFYDDFNSFDTSKWVRSDRGCPNHICSVSNVPAPANSKLIINIPAGRQGGGEIYSKSTFNYGTFQISMRTANVAWVRFAFFLFDPASQNEIDIIEVEVSKGVFGNSVSAYSTIWRNPSTRVWTSGAYNLWFDPSGGYHTYRLDYYKDRIQFYIDGRCVSKVPMCIVPFAPLRLYINSYTFKPFNYPPTTATLYVDWVQVNS